jgi:hypothetical protein
LTEAWSGVHLLSEHGKLRDELLAREVFDTLLEAKVLIERWRKAWTGAIPWQGYPGDRDWFHS